MRILCLALMTGFFACKTAKEKSTVEPTTVENSSTQEQPKLEQQILGNWFWWKTDCCSRMPHTTYSNEVQYERTLKFSKGGTLERFHNDTLKLTSKYEVYYGLMKDDDRAVLKIDERPALLYINGDTLIIDFGYMDLQTDYYLRKK